MTQIVNSLLSGQGLPGPSQGDGTSAFAQSPVGLDRLVRKETALGTMRDIPPPTDHIGLSMFAPFMEVDTDDVIFDYIKSGLQEGVAPARAEDAESQLAQKDDLFYGQGKASIIDWALKDKYTASDVTRYRDNLILEAAVRGTNSALSINNPGSLRADFDARVARDDARRVKSLYNRIEWLIMDALWKGQIDYNDSKIKFTVNYGRPAEQQDININDAGTYWDAGTSHDPIGDLLKLKEEFYDLYDIELKNAMCSKKLLNTFWRSERFTALTGLVTQSGSTVVDPNYLMNWNPGVAQQIVENATGIKFITHDSVYQTRAIGSKTVVNTRFTPQDKILFYPDFSDLGVIDDTQIGFGKTLTSPHPEGNWSAGFYEWEREKIDPWMTERGSGIKAFPIFPYLKYTVVAKALT